MKTLVKIVKWILGVVLTGLAIFGFAVAVLINGIGDIIENFEGQDFVLTVTEEDGTVTVYDSKVADFDVNIKASGKSDKK